MPDEFDKVIPYRLPSLEPKKKNSSKLGRRPGYTPSQSQLRGLMKGMCKPGEVLNPYGYYGRCFRSIWRLGKRVSSREDKVRRKRVQMLEKKRIALEAHELQQLARENATAAMQTLIEISKNKRAPEATRIAASQVILDRGYGKASQTNITANVTNGKTSEIDSTELDKRIGSALKRVEELTDRTPKTGKSKKGPSDLRKYN